MLIPSDNVHALIIANCCYQVGKRLMLVVDSNVDVGNNPKHGQLQSPTVILEGDSRWILRRSVIGHQFVSEHVLRQIVQRAVQPLEIGLGDGRFMSIIDKRVDHLKSILFVRIIGRGGP